MIGRGAGRRIAADAGIALEAIARTAEARGVLLLDASAVHHDAAVAAATRFFVVAFLVAGFSAGASHKATALPPVNSTTREPGCGMNTWKQILPVSSVISHGLSRKVSTVTCCPALMVP
jgi:hypothetical protein